MTTPPVAVPDTPVTSATTRRHIEEIVLIVLVLLSGFGVALGDSSPERAFRYWLWMTPVFGAVSMVAAWARAHRRGEHVARIVPMQAMHWLGTVAAMYLVYLLDVTGRLTNEAAGSATLVVIALSAFLAGVYGDWRMSLLGLILGTTAIGFAILEQFVWLIVLPLLVISVIAIVIYMRRR